MIDEWRSPRERRETLNRRRCGTPMQKYMTEHVSDSRAARVNGDRSYDHASGGDGSVGSQLSNAAVWISPPVRRALRISLDDGSASGNAADQGELAERIHPQDVPPLCMLLDWAAATPNAAARLQLRLADDGGKWVATVARISADDHGGAGLTIDLDGAVRPSSKSFFVF